MPADDGANRRPCCDYSPASNETALGIGSARSPWIKAAKSGVGSNTKLRRASTKGSHRFLQAAVYRSVRRHQAEDQVRLEGVDQVFHLLSERVPAQFEQVLKHEVQHQGVDHHIEIPVVGIDVVLPAIDEVQK